MYMTATQSDFKREETQARRRRFVSNGLIASFVLAFIASSLEYDSAYNTANTFYTLAGFGMIVFMPWAAYILRK